MIGDTNTSSSCSPCHNDKVSGWFETGHASMFTEAIDGIKSSHYNESCIVCHTLGLGINEDPLADNDGFDDIAADLGWTFPDTLKDGNWQDMVDNFKTLAQRANIQCEHCHGPAGQHVVDILNVKPSVSYEEGACGQCHDELDHHVKSFQWKQTLHANNVDESGRTSCVRCHAGPGFVEFADAGVPTNTTHGDPGYTATELDDSDISCPVCHDPHSADLEHQLRKVDDTVYLMTDDPAVSGGRTEITWGGLGKLCMNCHIARRGGDEFAAQINTRHNPHHGPQTDMMAGASAAEFGIDIPITTHSTAIENACVDCHMSPTPEDGQPGHNALGEHTWNMVWDNDTPEDPSDDVENVAPCQGCHGPITAFDDIIAGFDADGDGTVEGVRSEVHGLMETLASLLPPGFDQTGGLDSTYTVAELKAAFNYNFVVEDGSYGVHNAKYTIGILTESIAQLQATPGTGTIAAILDVPNDQGRQVRILWNKFAADSPASNEPITEYSLWRRVDEDIVVTKATKVASLDEMIAQGVNTKANARFNVNDTYWDYLKSVPATRSDRYSAIVPTLYDTTATEGIQWTAFFVAGHTENPETFVTSPVDSGYSVDNLEPSAPVNPKVITITEGGDVTLIWDDPVDADVNYFQVERGDDANFTSVVVVGNTAEAQIIDVGQTLGTIVYYRLSAFDFAGNRSAYSEPLEVLLNPVGIADGGTSVPKDYALDQNRPNPFNPTTTIRYALPKTSYVDLVIYDMLGREVRRLVQDTQVAGYHTVIWDGRNSRGVGVASGVYFYQIRAGSYVEMKKMTLLK